MLLRALPIVLVLAGCVAPRVVIERAQRALDAGRARQALADFDRVAARPKLDDRERLAALVGAAHACDALGDGAGALARLERAIARDVPGEIEPVEYELAERLREHDHARALGLYYRAAAGAERNRAGGFPYRAAMDRILQMSLQTR
jgi:tetratricopeptide (TPR) repeat protein